MVLMIGEVDPLHCEACELLRQRVRAATTPSFLLSNAFLRPRVLLATQRWPWPRGEPGARCAAWAMWRGGAAGLRQGRYAAMAKAAAGKCGGGGQP